jgi:hypothetical protein
VVANRVVYVGSFTISYRLRTSPIGVGAITLQAASEFAPAGGPSIAAGQAIQINAVAPPDSTCAALLSFADNNGNPIGPTQQVNLSPSTSASLSFDTNQYTKNGRQEYVPQLTPINTINPNGGQVNSICLVRSRCTSGRRTLRCHSRHPAGGRFHRNARTDALPVVLYNFGLEIRMNTSYTEVGL